MSFLRTSKRSKINYSKMPSPTYEKENLDRKSRKKNIIPKWFVRRMSLLTSFSEKNTLRGSMTVEAAVILPLFIFFFLHLMGAVEMLRLHSKLTFGMWNVGKQLTVYSAVTDNIQVDIPDIAVSYLYVQSSIEELLGKEYLDAALPKYGSKGLNYLSSDYDEDYIDIGVTYQVKPQITIFSVPYMRLVNRFYGRKWNGYDVSGEKQRYVYVTIYGEVWHATTTCSHIQIDVQETGKNAIGSLRNGAGKKYRLCELCEEESWQQQVYYTVQGDCYHKDKNCASLVRYVRAILWEENIPYRACSRCVKGESQ